MGKETINKVHTDIAKRIFNAPDNTFSLTQILTFCQEEWNEVSSLQEEDDDVVLDAYKKAQTSHKKTKQRWQKKELSISGYLQSELNKALSLLVSPGGSNKFKSTYGVSDYEELRKLKEEELEKWVNNEEGMLCECPGFQKKQNWQKVVSLKADIRLMLHKWLTIKPVQPEIEFIVSELEDWSNVPLDYTSKKSFPETEDGLIRNFTLVANDDISVVAELKMDDLKSNPYNSPFINKLMNPWDVGVMRFVLYKLAQQRYSEVMILTTIKEILDFMNAPPNGRNYEIVEASIRKLVGLTIFIKTPNQRFSLGFLQKYKIEDNPNGQSALTIYLNQEVYNQAFDGKITNMYKKVIDSLSPAATAMIYRLQKLRIQKYNQNVALSEIVDFNYFNNVLVMNQSRKSRMRALIESTLDEIRDMGVTLHSYKRLKGDFYLLNFLPLTAAEKRDLVVNTDTMMLLPDKNSVNE